MYETLLFLHVLSAFVLATAVVSLTSVVLGTAAGQKVTSLGNLMWDVGGLGTLVFGVWLVIDLDEYDITDGWILAALGMWLVAGGSAGVSRKEITPEGRYTTRGATIHWVRAVLVVAFLALMIWKPGA